MVGSLHTYDRNPELNLKEESHKVIMEERTNTKYKEKRAGQNDNQKDNHNVNETNTNKSHSFMSKLIVLNV